MKRIIVSIVLLVLVGFGLVGCLSTVVSNIAPAAAFTFTNVGNVFNFNGNPSVDSDGTIVQWTWTFGDGESATGQMASHEYDEPGTYVVKLVVKDDGGLQGSATQTIVIEDDPVIGIPIACFSWEIQTGSTVAFDGGCSEDPCGGVCCDGRICQASWNFGDGTLLVEGSWTNVENVTHEYSTCCGAYNATLTVWDCDGNTDSFSDTIRIGCVP